MQRTPQFDTPLVSTKDQLASSQKSCEPLVAEALNFVTMQLLITTQENSALKVEKPLQFEAQIEKKKRALAQKAKDKKSVVGAAFCSVLLVDNVTTTLKSLDQECKKNVDHPVYHESYEEIKSHDYLGSVFMFAPSEIKSLHRKKWAQSFYQYVKVRKSTEFHYCKFLIAARLEVIGDTEKAVLIYSYLMQKDFFPLAQLSNLIRIGENSPEALFQIGQYIIENAFNTKEFKPLLVHYVRSAIKELLSKKNPTDVNNGFARFCATKDPEWTDIALTCINLAVYNRRAVHVQAAKYLSELYLKGVQGSDLRASPSKACAVLEYAYHNTTHPKQQELLLAELTTLSKSHSEDPWAVAILANAYTKSLLPTLGGHFSVEQEATAQDADKYYQIVYAKILSSGEMLYTPEYSMIDSLAQNSFDLAKILRKMSDACSDQTVLAEKLLVQAENLLEQSSQIGCYNAHLTLAKLKESRSKQLSDKDITDIDRHYQIALEGAMVKLQIEDYNNILKSYQFFIRTHIRNNQIICLHYQLRLDHVRRNLKALELLSIMENASATRNAANTASTELNALSEGTAESPLAIAILWDRSYFFQAVRGNDTLLCKVLSERGLLNDSDSHFPLNIITLLNDYYILAKADKQALVFFNCLQSGLEQFEDLEDEASEIINTLINFYVNILDNKLLDCKPIIQRSPKACKMAFSLLDQRMLLDPDTYHALHGLLEPEITKTAQTEIVRQSPPGQNSGNLFRRKFSNENQEKIAGLDTLSRTQPAHPKPSVATLIKVSRKADRIFATPTKKGDETVSSSLPANSPILEHAGKRGRSTTASATTPATSDTTRDKILSRATAVDNLKKLPTPSFHSAPNHNKASGAKRKSQSAPGVILHLQKSSDSDVAEVVAPIVYDDQNSSKHSTEILAM